MAEHDIIVVGAGPAGLTAGVYGVRGGARVLLLEAGLPGGRVNYTHQVENYPGFQEAVGGMELAERMRAQAERIGVEFESEEVTALEVSDGLPVIGTKKGVRETKAVVIASGSRARALGVPGERRLLGRGVSMCAVCDGSFFRGMSVAVVGGGDSACKEALHLARICDSVHIVHRRDALRAAKVLQERVFSEPKITVHWSRVVKAFEGEERLERLLLASTKGEEDVTLEVAGAFLYVGNLPNAEFVKAPLERDDGGYIVTDERMRTTVERIYAAGDVRAKFLRQVVTAAADGAIAACDALERWME